MLASGSQQHGAERTWMLRLLATSLRVGTRVSLDGSALPE